MSWLSFRSTCQWINTCRSSTGCGRRQAARCGRFCPDSGQPAGRCSCCRGRPQSAHCRIRRLQFQSGRQTAAIDRAAAVRLASQIRPPPPPADPAGDAASGAPAVPPWRSAPGRSGDGPRTFRARPLDPQKPAVNIKPPPLRFLASMVSAPCSLWKTVAGNRAKGLGGHSPRPDLFFAGPGGATPLPGRPRPLCARQFRRRRGPLAGAGPFGGGSPRSMA